MFKGLDFDRILFYALLVLVCATVILLLTRSHGGSRIGLNDFAINQTINPLTPDPTLICVNYTKINESYYCNIDNIKELK